MINKGKHKLYYTIYLRGSAPWFSKKIKVNSGPHNHANIQSQKKEQELCIRKVKNRELYAMWNLEGISHPAPTMRFYGFMSFLSTPKVLIYAPIKHPTKKA